MLESIKSIDTSLLLFFNHLNNSFFDFVFYWCSDKWIWIPFYAYIATLVYKNDKSHFFVVLFFLAAAIAASDQMSSSILKNAVMRLRPCQDPAIADQVHLVRDYCGGMYGFVSSHASNVFTLAAFLTKLFKGKKFPLRNIIWIWAAVVSFSRIYLGAHYPGDVLCGALLGLLIGNIFVNIYLNKVKDNIKHSSIN